MFSTGRIFHGNGVLLAKSKKYLSATCLKKNRERILMFLHLS